MLHFTGWSRVIARWCQCYFGIVPLSVAWNTRDEPISEIANYWRLLFGAYYLPVFLGSFVIFFEKLIAMIYDADFLIG